MEKEREKIKHLSHEHPLVLNEELSDKSKDACCKGCLEPLFGTCFSCGECQFHLHKKCAQAPLQIPHSPFHCKHCALILMRGRYFCDLCKESRQMFFYCCPVCVAYLDIKCAFLLHNFDENFYELKYVDHEHPLTFIENPNDEFKRANCYWCQKLLADSVYVCLNCGFYLHKKCAQLPTQIYHPCHRKHPLYIKDARLFCQLCQKTHRSLFYRCLPCKFDVDMECVRSRTRYATIEDKSHLEHQFTKLFRNESFICDACGTEGNSISYICSSCHIRIHNHCISLPRIIKTMHHHHTVIHNYFFQKKDHENHDCGVCPGEVKAEYGSYNCLKQDCDFVAHVNCAMEMYVEIDQVIDQDEESIENLATNSSITRVIERNEHGEAQKVKHFNHEHDLTLGKMIEQDDVKRCDGCMLSISTSFYYCSECEFILHKTCAELPRKTRLWIHQSPTTLISSPNIIRCHQCLHLCSGFFYKSDESNNNFCLRCASVSHTLICEGEKHSLFLTFEFPGICSACGFLFYGAYKCKDKDCTLALDFACIALPQATWHKCDKHLLKLKFHDENDDPEQHCCDICEGKRDPNHWFYHCAICDNSAHPKCALGKYPFIKMKIGTTFSSRHCPYSRHSLIFVETLADTCSDCESPCQEGLSGIVSFKKF
ncbi:uncharacterized protein LOC111297663 [Durio zibethinus]|uniref:Uncharacterized protein LOC111297663 n=1 Tax=Durio zibethinus TaxID=66656 RepID=A0A6P5Z667_DURZI|nr:uncharacterized protein LOC111297663 [Durio zibethinus]